MPLPLSLSLFAAFLSLWGISLPFGHGKSGRKEKKRVRERNEGRSLGQKRKEERGEKGKVSFEVFSFLIAAVLRSPSFLSAEPMSWNGERCCRYLD